ncbi:MAG TPA: tetratricopeptide repeat protein [Pyrinomonadaceae bacterium]|jgi:tetratricopeptide (TPR) repeat protein|nr:tetratricopeptide repeat protein [Pyrinomonadaceae bacterium]
MSLSELESSDILKTCTNSSELIYAGRYEEARGVLGDLWRGVGVRPDVDHLPREVAAEVLLQCGALSGCLGSAQGKDVQERTKDLLTEALEIFQAYQYQEKVSEARYELGICYWRSGALDEARITLTEALTGATTEQTGKIIIGRTIVEVSSGRYEEARDILNRERSFFESASHALQGRWHGQMAIVLRRMAQGRIEYEDQAIIECTAAIYHYELARHERYCGSNLNNLAMLLYRLERYQEAHEHLDKAQRIFSRLKDSGNIAQVKETRARVLLAEERYLEARRVIIEVVDALERAGEQALLTDALIIKATVQARLGNTEESLRTFRHAIRVGEESGALFSAGLAAIVMIEEHGKHLAERKLFNLYRRADRLLAATQDADAIDRLRACARIVIRRLYGSELDEYFTLPETILQYEARFIEQALEEERGSVSRAARRLGLSHQTLGAMLNTRHQSLSGKRHPEIKRKRSIIKDR